MLGIACGLLLAAAFAEPASAVMWPTTVVRTVEPAGAGCGTTSTVTVSARAGASNVRVVHGDEIVVTDEETDLVVARLQSWARVANTRNGVPGVSLVFVGSGDVCDSPGDYPDGWIGEPTDVEVRYDRDERVRFREFVGPGTEYAREKPSQIHGGSDFGWSGIRWQRWGGRVALGRGDYYYVEKSQASYRIIKYPMRFRLSRPAMCDEGLRYTRMETTRTTRRPTRPRVPRHTTINLTCEDGIYGD